MIRHQLNLSEISGLDDSSTTDNVTLSRIQEITAQEIEKFEFLTQSDSSPPIKKTRVKSPSVTIESSLENLKITIPSSICDETSSEVSPSSKSGNESVVSSVDLKQLAKVGHKSDSELTKVHLLPKLFRSARGRCKRTPKILDLELLSTINKTGDSRPIQTTSFCMEAKYKNWEDSSSSLPISSVRSISPVTDFNYCTGLNVPVINKPKLNFPAISKITSNIGNLDESSSHCSSQDFQCIHDACYGDVEIEIPKKEEVHYDYVSYKHIANELPKESNSVQKVASRPSVVDALTFRETQSTELPFYDVASMSSGDQQSITLVSESERAEDENVCLKCFCLDLLFRRRSQL